MTGIAGFGASGVGFGEGGLPWADEGDLGVAVLEALGGVFVEPATEPWCASDDDKDEDEAYFEGDDDDYDDDDDYEEEFDEFDDDFEDDDEEDADLDEDDEEL